MISIFPADATDFSSNGLCALAPSSCLVNETLNGEWELQLVHPIEKQDKWAWLQVGSIIKAPVPAAMTPRVKLIQQTTEGKDIYRTNTTGGLLNLWAGPSRSYTSLARYKLGLEVQVISKANPEFYEVIAPDGKRGFMASNYLAFVRSEPSVAQATGAVVKPRQLRDQPFRIYRIVPELTQVTAYARHLSYDLMDNMIYQYKPAKGVAGAAVAAGILSHCQSAHRFQMHSDITKGVEDLSFENTNPMEALLGEGGLIDKTGGELARDWYDLYVVKRVGNDTDIQIRQGKNLLGISYDVDDADVVTRIVPTGENEDGSLLFLSEKCIDSPNIGAYPHPRWIHLPVSEAKVSDEMSLSQAQNKLRQAALAEYEKGCDLPDISIDVDFINVADTQEYADYKPLTDIFLGDSVRVIVRTLGLEVSLRMTEYSYDCLLKRYLKMTLGIASETVAGSMISPRQLPAGGIKGMKLAMGSVGTGQLQTASIGSLQVKTAAIGSAHIQSAAIDTAHIKDASIESAKIRDAAITNAKIDTAAIDTAHIKDAAITSAKIGTAAIDTANIQDAAIQSAKIADAAIVRAKIGLAAIGTAEIEEASIVAAHIIDGSITNAKIYDLSAEKITAGTIDANRIAAESITGAHLSGGTITGDKIMGGTITGEKIAGQTITGEKISANSITGESIAGQTITALHIGTGSLTGDLLEGSTITGDKILAGTITGDLMYAGEIEANKIKASNIGADQITAVHIAAAAIEAEHVKAGEISTEHLAANAIDAGHIKADAIQSQHIAASQILAGHIGAHQINGNHIEAVSITGAHIAAGTIEGTNIAGETITGTNILGETILGTHIGAETISAGNISAGDVTADRLYSGNIEAYKINAQHIASQAIKADHMTAGTITADSAIIEDGAITNAKIGVAAIGQANIDDLAVTSAKIANAAITSAKIAELSVEHAHIASAAIGTANIQDAAIKSAQIDAAAITTVKIEDAAITSAKIYKGEVEELKIQSASIANAAINEAQIADLAVTTAKIMDGAIVSAKIGDAEITSAKIGQAAIDTGHIQNASITSAKIYSGDVQALRVQSANIAYAAITEVQIRDASITSAKISNVGIDFAKIVNVTIGEGMIGNSVIDTAHIKEGSITDALIGNLSANKIDAGTLSVDRLVLRGSTDSILYRLNNLGEITSELVNELDGRVIADNTIHADKIIAGTILAEHIAADQINGGHILANSITTDHIVVEGLDASRIKAGTITVDRLASNFATDLDLSSNTGISIQINGAIEGKADKADLAGLVNAGDMEAYVASELLVREDAITNRFTTLTERVAEIDGEEGALATFRNAVYSWQEFSPEGLRLGRSDSRFQVLLNNEALTFIQDGETIAYISNKKLYISASEVINTMTIGNPAEGYMTLDVFDGGLVCTRSLMA